VASQQSDPAALSARQLHSLIQRELQQQRDAHRSSADRPAQAGYLPAEALSEAEQRADAAALASLQLHEQQQYQQQQMRRAEQLESGEIIGVEPDRGDHSDRDRDSNRVQPRRSASWPRACLWLRFAVRAACIAPPNSQPASSQHMFQLTSLRGLAAWLFGVAGRFAGGRAGTATTTMMTMTMTTATATAAVPVPTNALLRCLRRLVNFD
jgi:hypothetical protein